MSLIKEFKEFAMRGNVVDLAVGVVIGGAFGKIVTALVGDVIMPLVGLATQGVNFSELCIPLGKSKDGSVLETMSQCKAAGVAALGYGSFLQTILDFIIVAFAIFMMVKLMNAAKKKQEATPAAPAPTPEDVVLLREIRDSLRR